MKLPKKWGAHRRRNPSQRRVDDEFLDITSRLDDTGIFAPGPRDYELAEPNDQFQPPKLPALGFLDLTLFCGLLIYLRPKGRSALTNKWDDDDGARV